MEAKNQNLLSKKANKGFPYFLFLIIITLFLPMLLQGQQKRFTLLHTSDEHSVFTPLPAVDHHSESDNPAVGGFARLSSLVNQIREEKGEEPVLLLSAGDYVGGSPYAWLILEGYAAELELMQAIGYDAATVGNHEFDYGPEILADYYLRAGYPEAHDQMPVVISNLNIPDQHVLHQAHLPENTILELDNGLTVGIFGLLGRTAYSVAPMAEPVTISDPLAIAQQQADKLRDAGADIVLALSHSGMQEDMELAEKVDNIDIILGGHDHVQTAEPKILNNTILLHSSYYLQYLGFLELSYDTQTQTLSVVNSENNTPYQIALDHTVAEDLVMADKVAQYTQRLNDFVTAFSDSTFTDVYEHILYADYPVKKHAPMTETTIGNFVADAMRLQTEKVLDEKVHLAIQANGVIRGDIVPGTMEWSENKVSFIDLVTISGLGSGPDRKAGYPLVSVYLTAEEMYNVLEIGSLLSQLMGDTYFLQISGMKYTYDPGKATWLTIPFLDLPVPAYRSVKDAYIYTGQGIQQEDEYTLLERDSDQLYHLVADHYLTSFLPMIGEILPRLKLVLKDKNGNPLELDQTIVYNKEKEFKVWEAVAGFATSFPEGEKGIAVLSDDYKEVQGRIIEDKGVPLYVWSYTGIVAVVAGLGMGISWFVRKIRKKKKKRNKYL